MALVSPRLGGPGSLGRPTKPQRLFPLAGQPMHADSWREAGSVLPATAPALHRARKQQPLPPPPPPRPEDEGKPLEYQEYGIKQREAEEAEVRRREHQDAQTFDMARLRAIEEEAREKEEAALRPMPPRPMLGKPSPRSRGQVATSAGLHSAAATCRALMTRSLAPKAFAEQVATLPEGGQVLWLRSLGACIHKLGETLVELRTRLDRLIGSDARAKLQACGAEVVARCMRVEAEMEQLREGTKAALQEGERQAVAVLRLAEREFARRAAVRARWTRAAAAAVVQVRREARQVAAVVGAVAQLRERGQAADLHAVAGVACVHAQRLLGCGECHLYLQLPQHEEDEELLRLCPPHPTHEEEEAATSRVGAARGALVASRCLAGAAMMQEALPVVLDTEASRDRRYVLSADAVPGYENPATLCYVPLGSAEWAAQEGGNAVLRCAGLRSRHAAPGGGGGWDRRRLELLRRDVVPLLRAALRTCLDAMTAARDASMARALLEVGTLLEPGRLLELQAVVHAWSTSVQSILKCDRCTIFLYDGSNHQLIAFVAEGLQSREVVLALDEADELYEDAKLGVAGACAMTKEVINIEDAYADHRFDRSVDEASGYRTRTVLAMPFASVSNGELMGVVQVVNKLEDEAGSPRVFGEDDERLLETTLKLAALAIENVQLAEQYANLMKQYRDANDRRKSIAE